MFLQRAGFGVPYFGNPLAQPDLGEGLSAILRGLIPWLTIVGVTCGAYWALGNGPGCGSKRGSKGGAQRAHGAYGGTAGSPDTPVDTGDSASQAPGRP